LGFWVSGMVLAFSWGGTMEAQAVHLRAGACRWGVLNAEVTAGKPWVGAIGTSGSGEGLEAMLEPLPSGWVLRVLPISGARPPHDFAELATPPYASVSPLLISTDFSFRAQDAVAWNPRHFRYAPSRMAFERLLRVYSRYAAAKPVPAMLEAELARLATSQPPGEIEIVDAKLTPGLANQGQMAAMVASHFSTTAHTIEEPGQGQGTALGKLWWLRLKLVLELPDGYRAARGVMVESRPCE
jgi:hypothetical protein